jgi:hypothetical protein
MKALARNRVTCSLCGLPYATIELGFFSSLCGGYITLSRVEAGSKTSTATLRVVGGDKKGSLNYDVKYGRESLETRTRERIRWLGPAACTKDRPLLSSERASLPTKITVNE